MVNSYRDLKVWRKAVDLAISIYRLTERFPHAETFGIVSQMRRSAVSVPSNIAEGHGRLTRRDYHQFLSIARGSNFELQTQLEIAGSLGFGDPLAIQQAQALSEEIGKMIYAIAVKLKPSAPARVNPSA
ncbi:MAG TPA: four helix bundle protein [Terracidiphilus sp.]|nr:four helix bundle protein [Terracidiphilus sp.]